MTEEDKFVPDDEFFTLIGKCVYCFNNLCNGIIYNIEAIDLGKNYDLMNLYDREAGQLKDPLSKTISQKSGNTDIEDLFSELVERRNRIVHNFVLTYKGEADVASKTKQNKGNKVVWVNKTFMNETLAMIAKCTKMLQAIM